tara:strand:+ start:249 stop:389 length:141 start_codon:yes stop_codon:yes gene_type:complete
MHSFVSQKKKGEHEDLDREFDDFRTDSRELEEQLEAELGRSEEKVG